MQQRAMTPPLSYGNLSNMPNSILITILLLNDLSGSVTFDFHGRVYANFINTLCQVCCVTMVQ